MDIDTAIKIMERAKDKIHMNSWQICKSTDHTIALTETELHACGNLACFAGYIAVSPEAKEEGMTINTSGVPVFKGHYASDAIAELLNIDFDTALGLVQGDLIDGDFSSFYDKTWKEVTASDVIKKLKEIKESN